MRNVDMEYEIQAFHNDEVKTIANLFSTPSTPSLMGNKCDNVMKV